MHEMVIYGVSFDMVGKQPIVLLKTADGNKFLPIWIGHPEAAAILMKLQGAATPRPMTHDLFTEILGQLEARVVRIAVTELRENTFYALITVAVDGTELEIDSRPSDAIALAVRAGAPIFAAEAVIEESAIEFEHEDVNEEEVLPDGLVAQRPRVVAHERVEQALLAAGVEEVPAPGELVLAQLADEPEPRVGGLEDGAVGLGDALAQLADDGIVLGIGRPHQARRISG
jgi:bifunctional DNase/RNase